MIWQRHLAKGNFIVVVVGASGIGGNGGVTTGGSGGCARICSCE